MFSFFLSIRYFNQFVHLMHFVSSDWWDVEENICNNFVIFFKSKPNFEGVRSFHEMHSFYQMQKSKDGTEFVKPIVSVEVNSIPVK